MNNRKTKIEKRMMVMTSNKNIWMKQLMKRTKFGGSGKKRSTGKTRTERREKEIVRADSSEQTVVSNKTASSVLACTWIR